jgi:(1->4)-alpha-D-glucan 1-alpha-D-glucosylmutase
MYVMHVALQARRQTPELFLHGDYQPLFGHEHVVAFTRAFGTRRLICAVTRLSLRRTRGAYPFAVGEVWGDDRLRVHWVGRYRELLTDRVVEVTLDTPLRDVFRELPVALLVNEPAPAHQG